MAEALIVSYDPALDVELVELDAHLLESGGPTHWYCYTHQTFDCEITEEQQRAWDKAEEEFFPSWEPDCD